ncbi:MAG: alpha/beta fold hydrolase [Casimicrobiaceae bacterium]
MPCSRPALFACALAAALLASACGSDVAGKRTLKLVECRLPNLPAAAQCGELEVPEDRGNPAGRKIRIFAAVLPANTVSPKDDPMVILAGGPGQAASFLGPFAARLTELRRTRDVVLIDQRGTGRSSPLNCKAFKPRDDEMFDPDPLPRARECIEELRTQGVDAAQYTTTAWIGDLEAMREALGYSQWNLWGGSYGTRVAQEYLRRFPDRVRTATLDGVAPPGMIITLDVWRTRADALRAIFDACAQSATCNKAHPNVAATLGEIERVLRPGGRELDLMDPRTGAMQRERLTFDVVLGALQPLTYAPETATMLPEMLSLAARGDYGPLLAANPGASGNLAEQLNAALHFSVTCAEDVPRIKPGSEAAMLAGLPAQHLAQQTIAVCGVWPRGSMPADFADAVKSDRPVLLLSGGMDPVTPPAYGTEVLKGFPNGRHIIAPGYGHIVSANACGPRLLAAFVDDAGFARLPATCVTYFEKSVPPPLWSNRLVPQP